jgi:RNA polymerase sigma-70 factor (ECF subfamily)
MHSNDMQDRSCLERICQGDDQALADLFTRHRQALFDYLTRLTGDRSGAEDLVQEVFLVVWRDAGRFRGHSMVRTWLFGIAHNLGLMHLRRKHPELLEDMHVEDIVSDEIDPTALAELAMDRERLSTALTKLKAPQRAVIELTFYHGLTQAEVAEVLDCPIGTVKSRLHYALRNLIHSFLATGGQ